MIYILFTALAIPFFTGCILAFGGVRAELHISRLVVSSVILYGLVCLAALVCWIIGGAGQQHYSSFNLYESHDYVFPVSFVVDRMSLVFLCLTGFLSNIVANYSRYYLHREPGYQRFFATIMFLLFGLTLLSLAGTLDLLMAGWEFVGICSFLLIGFYQRRNNSVRNAFKVLAVYKVCDVGLLLGAWLNHLVWHEVQHFSVLASPESRDYLATVDPTYILVLTIMILVAAAGKSAQWPFTFWLSRAMEGPTPSSAIFYGALSVHAGVLLLYRMQPVWIANPICPWLIGGLGLLTAIVASGISRVQSNIKGQIAYSSAANVGVMFVELALGLDGLAMIHLVANACLRCYQLLVSPSVVAYMLRLQGSDTKHLHPPQGIFEKIMPRKLYMSWYIFCLNDGYLELLVKTIVWRPILTIGSVVQRRTALFMGVAALLFVLAVFLLPFDLLDSFRGIGVVFCSVFGLILAILAFAERFSAVRSWNLASLSAVSAGASVWILRPEISAEVALYGSGIALFWLLGLQSLIFISPKAPLPLTNYLGKAQAMPGGAVMLFVAMLGVSGFPISPTFIGQDILLHHASTGALSLVFVFATTIALNGLTLAHIYSKVCLGDPVLNIKATGRASLGG